MAENPTSNPEKNEERAPSPVGVVVALGAAGLLLVLLFFHSSPTNDLSIEQGQMAEGLVSTMMTNGVLVNYDCSQNTAWVNRAVWDKYNAEQKRNMTMGLATVCNTRNAGYRISILDYDTRKQIYGFDGKTLTATK